MKNKEIYFKILTEAGADFSPPNTDTSGESH